MQPGGCAFKRLLGGVGRREGRRALQQGQGGSSWQGKPCTQTVWNQRHQPACAGWTAAIAVAPVLPHRCATCCKLLEGRHAPLAVPLAARMRQRVPAVRLPWEKGPRTHLPAMKRRDAAGCGWRRPGRACYGASHSQTGMGTGVDFLSMNAHQAAELV